MHVIKESIVCLLGICGLVIGLNVLACVCGRLEECWEGQSVYWEDPTTHEWSLGNGDKVMGKLVAYQGDRVRIIDKESGEERVLDYQRLSSKDKSLIEFLTP